MSSILYWLARASAAICDRHGDFSGAWIRDLDRRQARADFHGPAWNWDALRQRAQAERPVDVAPTDRGGALTPW